MGHTALAILAIFFLSLEEEEEDEGWQEFGHLFGGTPLIEGRTGKNLRVKHFYLAAHHQVGEKYFLGIYRNTKHEKMKFSNVFTCIYFKTSKD